MTARLSQPIWLRMATLFAAILIVSATAAVAQGPKINEQPLRDFARDVQAKIDTKQVDVRKPFSVQMDAVVTDDGRLDRNASRFTGESGDPKMIDVAKQAIMAMGESGYFGYLQQAGISRATISVSQSEQSFTGNVHASENRFKAAMITSGINAFLSIGLSQDIDPNQRLVLQNTRAVHDAGNIDITCTLPAAEFQRMILGNRAAGPSQ